MSNSARTRSPSSGARDSTKFRGIGDGLLITGDLPDYSHCSDSYFLQIMQNLPAAVYTTDAEGRITFYNEAAAALWGRRPKLGEDWWCGSWRLYWPDGTPMAHHECPMAITLKTGQPVRGAEAVAERPDGTRYPFTPYPTPLYDSDGKLIGALNMLVDITERKKNEEAAQRLAAVVESSDDAIISKDLNGIIVSWNKAAQRLFGYTAEEIVGKPVLTLIPPNHQDEEPGILQRLRRGERIEHYETVRQRKDGSLFDISLTVSPIKAVNGTIIGASKIARDITERKRAEELLHQQSLRLEILNQIAKTISRDLDLERTVQSVTDIATEITSAKFGAFFYNVIDDKGETYTLYTLSGAPREAFEKFGMPRNTAVFDPTFRGTHIVRSDDIRADPRYGKNAPHHGMPKGHLPVVSYLAVPVIGRDGEVLGGLFFGHDEPGIFKQDAEETVVGIASHASIAIENARLHRATQDEVVRRRSAEEAKELLLDEIQHRIKNMLATVQSIATQTFRTASSDDRQSFGDRIQAVSGAYDLLTRRNWDGAAMADVVGRALAPFKERGRERFQIAGPEASLNATSAVLFAMILHELATNAIKYGALSNDDGYVSISWELIGDEKGQHAKFCWCESKGPTVQPPKHKGFGSTLIERALEGERGRASVEFAPSGLTYTAHLAL